MRNPRREDSLRKVLLFDTRYLFMPKTRKESSRIRNRKLCFVANTRKIIQIRNVNRAINTNRHLASIKWTDRMKTSSDKGH